MGLEGDESFQLRALVAGSVVATLPVTIADDDISPALHLYTIAPCRVLDTAPGGLIANEDRVVQITGLCGVPANARAVTLTITVVNAAASGHLRIHPNVAAIGPASVVNYAPGETIASNGHFFLDPGGSVNLYCSQPPATPATRVLIDVTGYFQP
jgi:hypothetical protein